VAVEIHGNHHQAVRFAWNGCAGFAVNARLAA
jgi:hypothetical protein